MTIPQAAINQMSKDKSAEYAAQSLTVSELKSSNQSCATCSHCMAVRFTMFCRLKEMKPINHYNICHHHIQLTNAEIGA